MDDNIKDILKLTDEVNMLRMVREMAFVGFNKQADDPNAAMFIHQKIDAFRAFDNYLYAKEKQLIELNKII